MKASIAREASYASRKLMGLLKKNTIRKVKEGDAARRFLGKIIIIKKKTRAFSSALYFSYNISSSLHTSNSIISKILIFICVYRDQTTLPQIKRLLHFTMTCSYKIPKIDRLFFTLFVCQYTSQKQGLVFLTQTVCLIFAFAKGFHYFQKDEIGQKRISLIRNRVSLNCWTFLTLVRKTKADFKK